MQARPDLLEPIELITLSLVIVHVIHILIIAG